MKNIEKYFGYTIVEIKIEDINQLEEIE